MIYLGFNITLPSRWSGSEQRSYSDHFCKYGKISKNKGWEFQFGYTGWTNFAEVKFDWSSERDHAGVELELTLLGWMVILQVIDKRHWNYDEGRWYRYDEDPDGE